VSLRDADADAIGVQNAEAVGHRRALTEDAHGAVTVEDLGRFEVRAHAHETGRIDVHVSADRDTANVALDAHATELRADLRAEIPRAVVDVDTSGSHKSAMNPDARSSNRENTSQEGQAEARNASNARGDSRDSRDAPRQNPRAAPVTTDDASSAKASSNRRSARVRIVL
jgi:hypothetical protein